METTFLPLTSRASRPVDGALVNLRWAVIALAWAAVWLVGGQLLPQGFFLVWLITYAAFNGLLLIGVRYRQVPPRLPLIALIGDVVFLSILPLLPDVNNPFLVLFGIFPTLVAAMRFGVTRGLLVAFIVVLPYELSTLAGLLPPEVRAVLPVSASATPDLVAAFLPLAALLGAVVLVGYLTQREREAAIGSAQVELDELRQAFASARLFYESSDVLSSSANYVQILDVMLQAGVTGMPPGRFDQGNPVGMALVFDPGMEPGKDKPLTVAAARGVERSDMARSAAGQAGITARAIESGDPIPFTRTATDPELAQFTSLRRVRNGICFPLQSGLDVYGLVILGTPANEKPSEQHLRLMRAFINQAAIALQNAQLYQNLRLERDRIIEAEAAARSKLARDLHDGPTQSMAALAMRLDFIRLLLDRDPTQARQELDQAREEVMRVGKDMRGLLFTLRPLTLESQGLSAAVKQHGERLRETENLAIQVQPGNFGVELDPHVAGTVFAVVEEAVNNARKHARGAPIQISLAQQNGTLIATVRDQGPGFDVAQVNNDYAARGSLGMVNMQDRARLVDGKLAVDSAPGRGTQVTLRVPIKERRSGARAVG